MMSRGDSSEKFELLFDWFLQSIHYSIDVNELEKIIFSEVKNLKKSKRKVILSSWIKINSEECDCDKTVKQLKKVLRV